MRSPLLSMCLASLLMHLPSIAHLFLILHNLIAFVDCLTRIFLRHHPLMFTLTQLSHIGGCTAFAILTGEFLSGAWLLGRHISIGIVEFILEIAQLDVDLGQLSLIGLELLEMVGPFVVGADLRSHGFQLEQEMLVLSQSLSLILDEHVFALERYPSLFLFVPVLIEDAF